MGVTKKISLRVTKKERGENPHCLLVPCAKPQEACSTSFELEAVPNRLGQKQGRDLRGSRHRGREIKGTGGQRKGLCRKKAAREFSSI